MAAQHPPPRAAPPRRHPPSSLPQPTRHSAARSPPNSRLTTTHQIRGSLARIRAPDAAGTRHRSTSKLGTPRAAPLPSTTHQIRGSPAWIRAPDSRTATSATGHHRATAARHQIQADLDLQPPAPGARPTPDAASHATRGARAAPPKGPPPRHRHPRACRASDQRPRPAPGPCTRGARRPAAADDGRASPDRVLWQRRGRREGAGKTRGGGGFLPVAHGSDAGGKRCLMIYGSPKNRRVLLPSLSFSVLSRSSLLVLRV
nr:basic proline-rich protein isoform X1 [Aegilops tauschii subsp. strangulata]XP_045084187.1 basic proline-rich protein isoform X2 [Aegilops tauschii subsp. strangulata]